ncbi:MAG TPA: hypothetical protein VFS59_01815 [Gemmatimonadaceae bacterium]|nr:hypothetical protein [Gemmatimonadaceae bacterium]
MALAARRIVVGCFLFATSSVLEAQTLHVPDPDVAAEVYTGVMGCRIANRTAGWIELHSPGGFYVRDPSGVVFDVIRRDATD